MSPTSPEQRIGSFVADLEYRDVPDEAIETIERAVLDTIGVTLAGAVAQVGRATTRSDGPDPDTADAASLLGLDASASPAEVALRVGTASHALDYDDLSWAMDGHPSVTLVPALFALADAETSGQDFITAYAAGFETECAVAEPISPAHYERGWHATATFGTFGATAAAAHLLGLDADRTATALSIAASTVAGLKRNFGSMTKPLHAGLCCRSGVTAARLARDGLSADATAVSGDGGFWDLYGPAGSEDDGVDAEAGDADAFSIGDRWRLAEVGINAKAYPCCYFTHTAIAATQDIRDRESLDPETIEDITVTASPGAADALSHSDPTTGLEAKFSMEYCVASAAVRDRVALGTFDDDAIDDRAVQRVRERVTHHTDADLAYDAHASTVRIETDDGATYRRELERPPGTHDDPLSAAAYRRKFIDCATVVLEEPVAAELHDVFTSLASVESVPTAIAAAE
ncbi:2-methylcitrate dehydratase PrpD [Halopenitus malekzadehii]|uniref:2-methylcitrate dehydratase PrpD n=1 Tax=Halopenitus malekzadehii TaxID=1267564 RepID=A0A1H6IUB4_9EURY|nr:MmgE/PrpD family protein [Halopenitus malekzadehii]SEH49999.1 2-methylcitrate dehydratase PrpD [Halopenitus malekzadehii]